MANYRAIVGGSGVTFAEVINSDSIIVGSGAIAGPANNLALSPGASSGGIVGVTGSLLHLRYGAGAAADASLVVELGAGSYSAIQWDNTNAVWRLFDGTTWSTLGPLTTTAPANVTKAAAAVGTSNLASRSDHKHDISTASAVSVGTANAEGTSTNLARADHTHQVTGLTITGQAQGDILYFNGTSWVRLAAGTAGQVLQTNGAGANPSWTSPAANPAVTAINVATTTTTTSATDVLMSGMTTTPGAGNYMVWFSGDVSNGSNNTDVYTSLYVGGTQVSGSERYYRRGNQTISNSFASMARVTVNGAQAIEGRWRTSGGTASCINRQLYFMQVQ